MNKEDLFKEIGDIDSKYIEEADASKRKLIHWKRYTAIAAVFIIGISIASSSEYVQAAIKRLFSFVPGVAITEEEKSNVLYSMDGETQTQSNGFITFSVTNAYVSAYDVDIAWEMSLDFMKDEKYENKHVQYEELVKAIEDAGVQDYIIPKEEDHFGPSISTVIDITIADKTYYSVPIKSGGSSLTEQDGISGVEYVQDLIKEYGANLPITVTICGMSFDVKLKPIEYYDSVEQIGPTVLQNDISLTAMPTWTENELKIKMYSINYSEFSQVYGFIYYRDDGDIVPYLVIGEQKIDAAPMSGDGTEYSFDLEDYSFTEQEKATAELHMPIVEMLNQEDVTFDIKVNDDGTVTAPKKISFKYADLNIQSMYIGSDDPISSKWEDCVEMKYTVTNKVDNIDLEGFSASSINGKKSGGMASMWEDADENGICRFAFSHDETKIKDYKTVTLSNPTYLITDEYVFKLSKS